MKLLLAVTEDSATLRSDMSAVYGVGVESDATDIALFLYCAAPSRITLHGKPQSDKPRARAEPGEPKAPLLVEALTFSHRFLAADENRVCIVHDAVTDGVSQNRISQFVTPAGNVELGTQNGRSSLIP